MGDVVLPLECIAEWKLELEGLKSGHAILPPWFSQADVPALIQDAETNIRRLEEHVKQHGNTWQTEYE